MDIFKLFGRIAIDSSEASDELSRFIKQANNAGKKVGKVLTDITKGAKSMATTLNRVGEQAEQSMRKIAGGFAIATTAASAAAVTIGKKALDIRSSIEQGMGGADAVFQQYARHIKESAQDAWKTAGLSMEEYLATANKMGSLFQGAGFTVMESMELTANAMQRAADVASIMGIDIGAAMESIAGMAKGNFTMMDNLGVAINDTTLQVYALEKGISKSVSTMTTAEKVGLAYEMFMERTAKYAGNYAKENETAAGSLQTLTAAWENFLGGVGSFEDLENSAFGYLRIAAKTMSLDDFLPLIDAAQKTVHEVSEILTTAELDWTQKLDNVRKYLLDESVSFVSALGDHFVKSAGTIYSIISETLSDINVYLPNYLEAGRNIFNAVRDGVKKAANELINSASIISPDVVSGWFDLKTDFITIGLNFLGGISQAISDDLKLGKESKVGKSLEDGLHNVVEAAAVNLPKMTRLATALIDGLANAILSTDEDGKTIDDKINAMIDNILDELEKWIADGGPGRFTYAAGTFLFNFGEALIAEAPRVFSGLMDGLISAFNGAITSVDEFFFGKKEPEVTVEASSDNASGGTTKKGSKALPVEFTGSGSTGSSDPLAEALGAAATAGILYKHPIIGTALVGFGSIGAAIDWLKSGEAEKAAQAAKEATNGLFDPTRLFAHYDENGEAIDSEAAEQMEAWNQVSTPEYQAEMKQRLLGELGKRMEEINAALAMVPFVGPENEALNAELQALEEQYNIVAQEIENMGVAVETVTDSSLAELEAASNAAAEGGIAELDTAASAAAAKLNNINPVIHYYRNYGGGVNDSIQFGAETPGFASGLAFVPRDNLLARLHQGEAVLTAQEAYEWRQQKKMGSMEAAIAQLANAVAEMQEGFQANMNLYINKKHVASALSRDMGRSIGNREYTLVRGMGG